MRRVLVIGGTGDIGKAVVAALKEIPNTEVIIGGRTAEFKIDITNPELVTKAFEDLSKNPVDAIVCAVGDVLFKPVVAATRKEVEGGFTKYFGQVDVVLQGIKALKDNGSITLTSGCLDVYGIPYGAFASGVNASINGFVRTASNELPRGIRLNVVSPGLLTESVPKYGPYFAGFNPVDGKYVAQAYIRSIQSNIRGKVITINGAPYFEEK